MKRRTCMQAAIGLGVMGAFPALSSSRFHWQSIMFTGFGTTLSIRAAHENLAQLKLALSDARRVVESVEDQMSLFRPGSAINQLNREGVLNHPDANLVRVLRMSQHISQESRGAFDITVQPLWILYAAAQKEQRLPTREEVIAARKKVGWRNLAVSPEKVALKSSGMAITLNGIAQGFACDMVRARLKQHGVAHALINTGEWSAIGLAEASREWSVGVVNSQRADSLIAHVQLNGLCLATSADDQCAFTADRSHHHILNPHTGYSPPDIASVTVAASSCATADALTKVLFVEGYERALQLAAAWKVHALVIHKDGRHHASTAMQVFMHV